MKAYLSTIAAYITVAAVTWLIIAAKTQDSNLMPEMEEEQLPIIVQHDGHKLLRVDDYEVGKHCYFWHDQVGSMFCIDMAPSHDAERE